MQIKTTKETDRLFNQYDPTSLFFNGKGTYGQEFAVSMPLYPHDLIKVGEVVNNITFPNIKRSRIVIYLPSYNLKMNCNGLASSEGHGEDKIASVFLLGKSTPIPYSMTEYCLPHEIGHAIQYLYAPMDISKNKNWKEYLKIRGIRNNKRGKWTQTPQEIFANDFRILFSSYQHDFWPHPILHPFKIKGLKEWFLNNIKIT